MDVVISVDSSAAHLAGAMARPAFTLLSHMADWRYRAHAETTAWYPTMRLFRQSTPGRWSDVIERVAAALRARVKIGAS
jgi:ADP-heptose:LPS heptosyltransferase